MANTQGLDPLCWHDDDLLLLEDIANLHSLLPDLPSQESHTAQPVTSSSGAPLQKMNRGYQKRYKQKQKVRPVHLPSLKQLNRTLLLDLGCGNA